MTTNEQAHRLDRERKFAALEGDIEYDMRRFGEHGEGNTWAL